MARHSIDERSADRLLSGAVDPDDAPPGYEQVARLVRVSQGPAGPAELARELAIVSSAAAAVLGAGQALGSPGRPHRRRNKVISKLGAARAAAITVAAVLGAGAAAAAATGNLPSQGSTPSSGGSLTVSGAGTTGSNSGSGGSGNNGNPNPNQANPLKLPATGPGNFHAVIGLCRAFLEHNPTTGTSGGATTPPEDNSTAFQALIKDATGSTGSSTGALTATATFCTNYLKNYSPGQSGSAPNNSSSSNANETPGKPTSPGNSGSHPGGNSGSNTSVHGDGSSTGNGAGGGAGSAGSGGAGRR